MGSGDLTASTPVVVSLQSSGVGLKTAIDSLNLAAVTDKLVVIPQGDNSAIVFKVERAA